MKRLIALSLALAMLLALAGCGCNHTAGDPVLTDVDTAKLTAKWQTSCTQCGKILETTDTATGVAPRNSTMALTPAQWFECLTTNIKTYDSSGMLVPMAVESEDDALLRSVVSPTGFKSVLSFFDAEDNVITTQTGDQAGLVHRIRIEAQFDNDTATIFYTFLMLMAMTNNQDWNNDAVNALAKQIMAGETVTDNGYSYTMQIVDVATHTVAVNIVAE